MSKASTKSYQATNASVSADGSTPSAGLSTSGKPTSSSATTGATTSSSADTPTSAAQAASSTAARIKNSALVFAGGASYGLLASTAKLAYGAGFEFKELVFTQALYALGCFLLLSLIDKLRGKQRLRLTIDQIVRLMLMGVVTSGTTTFYYLSLSYVPATVAVTLLFQFTWIGLIFEVVSTKKAPNIWAVSAAVIVFIGTLFASGVVGGPGIESLHPVGIACGLVSAFCCASFLFLSGRVQAYLPVGQRGLWASLGYVMVASFICPTYFADGSLAKGMWEFGFILGPLGFFLPMMLFGIGCKHLSPGLSAIMASSELPISILCSVIILAEPVSDKQVLGVCAILAGIVIAEVPSFLQRKGMHPQPYSTEPKTSNPL